MDNYKNQGIGIRKLAKELVLNFMNNDNMGGVSGEGIKQAHIFKECGFDWGDYDKASSSRQQFWIVGLLKELEAEGRIEQVTESGPWRLK